MKRIVATLGMTVLLSGAADGNAQPASDASGPVPGRAFSTNYQDLPAGAALRVQALDNSPTNQRAARTVGEALTRAGIPPSDAGPYRLGLETEVNPLGTGFARDRRDVDATGRYYQFNVPLGRPSEPATPAARQAAPPPPAGSVQFVMTLTLDDQSGRRYWHGQAYYTGGPDEQEVAFNAMARILVEQFGRTVRQRGFRIQ